MTDETMNDEEEIVVLADGAILKNGRLLTEDEERAEAANLVLLGDVLKPTTGIAAPAIHSPAIQAILNCKDEPEEKRSARLERLSKIEELKRKEQEEKE